MGVPGTGPLQSREILRQALQLRPKVIIFGFYFGNDLLDDFFFAEKNERLSEFLTAKDIADVIQAEHAEDLKGKVDVLFNRAMPANPPQQTEHLSNLGRIKNVLADNSRLYRFLRSLKKLWFDAPPRELAVLDPRYEDAVAGILEYQRPYVTPFSEGGWKTVFTSPYPTSTGASRQRQKRTKSLSRHGSSPQASTSSNGNAGIARLKLLKLVMNSLDEL
jgi:hypothetical protein